jgi:hypothetical protein
MADIEVTYDPITITSEPITINNGAVTVDIKGLDNTKNTITLETPHPLQLKTKSDFEFSTPEPIKLHTKSELDSRAELDVKPLAVDQCLRISLGPLPPTCIRVPVQQKIGFTIFGVEIVGFRFSGETRIEICDPGKEPYVVWGEVAPASPGGPRASEASGSFSSAREEPAGEAFRIALGGDRR